MSALGNLDPMEVNTGQRQLTGRVFVASPGDVLGDVVVCGKLLGGNPSTIVTLHTRPSGVDLLMRGIPDPVSQILHQFS